MKQNLYTLAIGHLDRPAAEIFTSERAALRRRLELAEVDEEQRTQILRLFDSGDAAAYELALTGLNPKPASSAPSKNTTSRRTILELGSAKSDDAWSSRPGESQARKRRQRNSEAGSKDPCLRSWCRDQEGWRAEIECKGCGRATPGWAWRGAAFYATPVPPQV